MGDQATSAAAAGTHSFSSSRSKEQSASRAAAGTHPFSSSRSKEQSASAAAAVSPGQWEQVLYLWQCGPLCHELPKKSAEQMPAPNQDKGRKQKVQVRQGKLNFTTLEELPKGAPIMTGIFLVFNQPALILFDSGASHSFII